MTDPSHIVDYEPLQLNENLSYEEKLIQILAREMNFTQSRDSTSESSLVESSIRGSNMGARGGDEIEVPRALSGLELLRKKNS